MGMYPSDKNDAYHVGDVIEIELPSNVNDDGYNNISVILPTANLIATTYYLPKQIGSDVTGVTLDTNVEQRVATDLDATQAIYIKGLTTRSASKLKPNAIVLLQEYTSLATGGGSAYSYTGGRKSIYNRLYDTTFSGKYFKFTFT